MDYYSAINKEWITDAHTGINLQMMMSERQIKSTYMVLFYIILENSN